MSEFGWLLKNSAARNGFLGRVRVFLNRIVGSVAFGSVIPFCGQMMERMMAAPLSMDRRMRVACALDEGHPVRAAAERFGVSVASAVRIGQRQRAGRGQAPGRMGGHRRPVLSGEAGVWLLARLAEKPDLTMRALTADLAGRGVHVAHDTVWRFVRRAGQTVKKDPDGQRADAPEGRAVPGALADAPAQA